MRSVTSLGRDARGDDAMMAKKPHTFAYSISTKWNFDAGPSIPSADGRSSEPTMTPMAPRHEPFIGKVAILQQWLPGYRLPFFDMLAERCSRGVTVYAGESPTGDPPPVERLRVAKGVSCRNTRIFRGGRFELMLQRGVIEWLEASDPDVLVATPNPRMPHVLLAQRWMRRRGRPCLGWGLGTMAVTAGMPTGLRSLLRKPILRGFDGLICYSSRAAKEYEAAGFPTSRIAVARNATARRPDASPPTRTSIAGRPVRVLDRKSACRERVLEAV
jgi:hypothetical protein